MAAVVGGELELQVQNLTLLEDGLDGWLGDDAAVVVDHVREAAPAILGHAAVVAPGELSVLVPVEAVRAALLRARRMGVSEWASARPPAARQGGGGEGGEDG